MKVVDGDLALTSLLVPDPFQAHRRVALIKASYFPPGEETPVPKR